jgi:hypothetical protein
MRLAERHVVGLIGRARAVRVEESVIVSRSSYGDLDDVLIDSAAGPRWTLAR